MEISPEPHEWAKSEFGHAALGDVRNTTRLIEIGVRVAQRPHAKVAAVFDAPHELQAAYDFLENERIAPSALVAASARATAQRAAAHARVLIPCDGACVTLRDLHGARGTGSVGRRSKGARGLQVLDAVALDDRGTPLGLAGLMTWARPLTRNPRPSRLRPVKQREIHVWLDARRAIRQTFKTYAPDTQRVFLLDSGADAWPVLLDVVAHDTQQDEITVVRAAHNRRAFTNPSVPSYLWPLLRRSPQRWRVRLQIPPGHGRTARRAQLEICARKVTLDLKKTPSSQHEEATLWAVLVRERGRVPRGEERLEWLLLTNWPTPTRTRALEVIRWYLLRWRVEDFHKTWKRSGSDIEQTQLRSRAAIERWMVIHAAVSARALALTHQGRDPVAGTLPATEAFSASELTALRALRAGRNLPTPSTLTVAEAVVYVAILGGYMPAKNRPPGPKILRRGLERLEIAALVVDVISPPKKPPKARRK